MRQLNGKSLRVIAGPLIVLFLMAACGGAATEVPIVQPTEVQAEPEEEQADDQAEALVGDMVRGGKLYDTWWVVLASEEEGEAAHDFAMDAPTTDQPLWATQSTNTRTGAETWRCKECHGWDYLGADGAYGSGSHFTGFPGVLSSSGMPVEELLDILRGSTNPEHDFSGVLEEQSLIDLAVFLSEGLIDTSTFINADKSSQGDAAAGEGRYVDVCALCHGPQGVAINFGGIEEPEYVVTVALDNPWEFLHKVRFGQPGWPMPSAVVNRWSDAEVADLLAYAQTLPQDASLNQGGKLYDTWWEVLGLEAPEGDQPLWASQTTNTRSGVDTWRCKECHGWDYSGAEGAYGSGSHFTGFQGVLGASDMTAEEVAAWLDGSANPSHDFSVMGEAGMQALVTFLREETYAASAYIGADKTAVGDPAAGKSMWDGTCSICHGIDGRTMNFGSAEEPEFVGTIARDNPWEFIHKAAFGQPGAPMPSGLRLGWSLDEIADLLAFAQTLPSQ